MENTGSAANPSPPSNTNLQLPKHQPPQPSPPPLTTAANRRDFLTHVEIYLAKRDGVDKILKISRYATKIILSSNTLPETLPLTHRLKSFDSSVGLSRKAFRLGKFIQDVNALRTTPLDPKNNLRHFILTILSYGGEGIYYFVEQFIWLSKAGLIDGKHAKKLQKVSAWAEFVGYIGSISLKMDDLTKLNCDKEKLDRGIESGAARGINREAEMEKLRGLRRKIVLKKMSVVQDLADALMAVADIRDGKGRLAAPIVVSSAGLLSALISTHKNWVSC